MNDTPRVTIGLPVFNGESHLTETLDSLLAQDFDDFELIVSDNASTDRTGEIVADYIARDRRIRHVRSDTNLGAAANYNRPVHLARGEYFKWASDDDLVAPTYISACVSALDADPDVVLAYGQTKLIDIRGTTLGDHDDRMHLPQPEPWHRMRDFAAKRWLSNSCFGVMRTSMMRTATDLITDNESSDITFLGQVALAGKVHEVPERLFFRRVSIDSRGLGEFDDDKQEAWYGPAKRHRGLPPLARVFVDIERSILRSDLSPGAKARTVASFTYAWNKRRAGIALWRARRRLRGGRPQSFAAHVARQAADANVGQR